jgi:hypothetical protein
MNIAYYRAGYSGGCAAYETRSNFWRCVSGNFIDTAVLAWCKLFANNEEHSWKRIVPTPSHDTFQADLLRELGITAVEWNDYINVMRTYRDKFLAHLDSDETMAIPRLDLAIKSAIFYGEYLTRNEGILHGLAAGDIDFEGRYGECYAEGAQIYGTGRDSEG